jgi:uncharacterized protein involved in exopolysaccharide biosynthesis
VLIVSLALCGLLLAAWMHFSRKPVYASDAKLLVRYVLERGAVDPYEARQNPGAAKADQVIQTEIEILTSMDLALEVARDVGVEKISPGLKGERDAEHAAAELLGHLKVVVGQSNNVLLVKYSHGDPAVTKEVLHKLMDAYFQKHLLIHRSAAAFDLIANQTKDVKEKLGKTEEKLNKLRTESGITSLGTAGKNRIIAAEAARRWWSGYGSVGSRIGHHTIGARRVSGEPRNVGFPAQARHRVEDQVQAWQPLA